MTHDIDTDSAQRAQNRTKAVAITAAILTPAAYSYFFDILNTLSRSSLGTQQAFSPRYNSITYIPIICLLLLIIPAYRHHFSRSVAVSLACISILLFGPGSIPNITLPPAYPTWQVSLRTMNPNRERLWQYYLCATEQSHAKQYPGSRWCDLNYSAVNVSPGTAKLFIAGKLKLTPGHQDALGLY